MRTICLDCFAGISGNMFLGAMLDLGVPEEVLRTELNKLELSGYELVVQKVLKQGISAVYVDVRLEHQHHHRVLSDIYKIIEEASLSEVVRDVSKRVFLKLAEAEATVHGTTIDTIHFHEVGAVDAIVDIVGGAICLDYLGVERIYTSKLRTGNGFVKCSHGTMPVPAPATAELLRGFPYETGDIQKELVTPTGAALVAALCQKSAYMPEGFISEKVGYGAGTWDLEIPNVLRSIVGEMRTFEQLENLLVVEANIDDLNPQIYPYVIEKLLAMGANDAWVTPIVMKKGRPAVTLSALIEDNLKNMVLELILAETTTIGVRFYPVGRLAAERHSIYVDTAWGPVRTKVSSYQGIVHSISPEFEDCRRLAEEADRPLKEVCQEALSKAWMLYGSGHNQS
ncbi:MAG: hypothetical protein H6Q75_833 [Firmicutes bacterium]|nr:hypothetical protein [Bacillota bacterium]